MDMTGAGATHRAAAIEAIRAEHRSLSEVLELMQHLLKDIAAGHAQPDFPLLCTVLYYIDDFACRCHHPKEEQHLFSSIRRCAPESGTMIAGLRAEHQRDYTYVKDLYCLLVLYQAGAPGALQRLIDLVDMYAAMLREHMRREEALLESYAGFVPEAEWARIDTAFRREDDPMSGPAPRAEFAKLRTRITNMLPAKLRRHVPEHADKAV